MFTLHAPAFAAGELIPKDFTCEGKDHSPELRWENPPARTKSFVLICDDPDAPNGTWTHWVVYDLPGTVTTLAKGNFPASLNSITSLPRAEFSPILHSLKLKHLLRGVSFN